MTSNNIAVDTYYTIPTKIISLFSGVFLAFIMDEENNISLFKNKKVRNKIEFF